MCNTELPCLSDFSLHSGFAFLSDPTAVPMSGLHKCKVGCGGLFSVGFLLGPVFIFFVFGLYLASGFYFFMEI